MTAVQSPFANNGYGSNPVITGASALNEILAASSATAAAWQLGLLLQAATPVAGVALVNGTPTILTWSVPNDGQDHRFAHFGSASISSASTGGQVVCSYTAPDSANTTHTVFPATQAQSVVTVQNNFSVVVKAGSTVTVAQSTALTGGAETVWAEIWGS